MTATKSGRLARTMTVSLGLLLAGLRPAQAERLPINAYTAADGLGHENVKCVFQDSRGFLWFCTLNGLSRFDGYRFITYRNEHGLPQVSINDMLQTADGTYWIATNGGGVCRFNPQGQPAVDTAIAPKGGSSGEPTKEPLFIVYRMDRGEAGEERSADDLRGAAGPPPDRVNVLFEHGDGTLWAGTDAGLFRLPGGDRAGSFEPVGLLVSPQQSGTPNVWSLTEDRQGNLWVGTSVGLVRRADDGSLAHFAVTPSGEKTSVWALLVDRQGRLWAGHEAGLTVLRTVPTFARNGGSAFSWDEPRAREHPPGGPVRLPAQPGEATWLTRRDGLLDDHVRTLTEAADGRLWIGTNGGGWTGRGGGGLTEFDGERFRNFGLAHGLVEDRVISLAEDLLGNLWVGTAAGGAMKVSLTGFVSYAETDGIATAPISSIFEDRRGTLGVTNGTNLSDRREQATIHWLDGNRFQGRRLTWGDPPSRGDRVHHALQDHVGEWWGTAGFRLYRAPKTAGVEDLAEVEARLVYSYADTLARNSYREPFEDSRGDLWLVGDDGGVVRWDRETESFESHSGVDGLPLSKTPVVYAEDLGGDVWVGFYDGGLARYRRGRFRTFTDRDGFPSSGVTDLHLDTSGQLWVATAVTGVSRLEDLAAEVPRISTYTTADGLSPCRTTSITDDGRGHLYIGTICGVDRLDPETRRVTHYTTTDGLPHNIVQETYRDRSGRLWFGTMGGLSRLPPRAEAPAVPPAVYITELRINGVPHPLSELGEGSLPQLELRSAQNHIQIGYVGLDFEAGSGMRYEYVLEGADADWFPPTDQRSVIYGSLSPGRYRFRLRALNADELRTATPATVAFRILPPFWQRGWFLALAVTATGFAIFAGHRYRLARLLELERVRTRIASDLHDDIGAGLSEIALMSEVVKRQGRSQPQESQRMLTEVAERARSLVDSMGEIVWSIDPRRDDLGNLVSRLREVAAKRLDMLGVRWSLTAPEHPERVKLTPEQRRHLFLVFKEALNNIARHSQCSRVWLELRLEDHRLEAEIRDDGVGFGVGSTVSPSIEEESHGNGLRNMRRRGEELGGRLEVESAPGVGTRLRLKVPFKG